ncbi:Melibiose/raffinose/stachyose import permease protein MelD [Paenibacillus allorhizoplanae]|uniref:Melibiose/raffinose/stachyose import permease protein MelD n=1 Tax=Paenibacillus allorhizoplanae TaxID=2905648 RepID=A0ABM9BT49_9BACL|nr:sugar ABC transporter permease [Paenibacillus allorhizoplanae]CAH1192995.1 Melibiose/raffinose/stachyose import permease protein MelD [Paenibacillus allorhizoplanae]
MNRFYIKKYYPTYFLIPILLVFTIFYVSPALLGLLYSITDASITTSGIHFVGLENYTMLFNEGNAFLISIWNQFQFAFFDAVGKTVIGLLIALLLNKKFRGNNLLRALVYMPIMFGTIVVGIIFNYILSSEGFLNGLLKSIGLSSLANDWLGSFTLALYSVIAVDVWVGAGWSVLVILAALQSVPKEQMESAEIDGAGSMRKFFSIVLPYIMHAINLSFLLSVISGLKAFDIIYAMTGGGPGHATEVMTTFLAKSMSSGSIGYPAAISVSQFVIITVVAMVINYFSSRREMES